MNEPKRRTFYLLPVAAILCVLSLTIMLVSLISAGKDESPAFIPPPFDKAAKQGSPVVPKNLGWGEIDAQAYKASLCGMVLVDGDSADIWLSNPKENSVWLKLRVFDADGIVLGETGLIKPDEYVQTVKFDIVPQDEAPIVLKLMAYQPDTYYSEGTVTLNTTVNREG